MPISYRTTFALTLFTVILYNVNIVSGDPKIDCHPLKGATKDKCESLGCVWTPVSNPAQSKPYGEELPATGDLSWVKNPPVSEPWCTFPSDYVGYAVDVRDGGRVAELQRRSPSGIPDDVAKLSVKIQDFGASVRIRIFDPEHKRFEPNVPVLSALNTTRHKTHDLDASIGQNGVLTVQRKSTKAVLFQTDLKKIIFSDRFIQLNSRLGSPFVYGLGEHYDTFLKYADSYKTYSFYHTDRVPLPGGARSYGTFPFYINLDSENQSHAHGVYLRNANGMDIILQQDQSVTFRPIGGILDFIIFDGPTPHDVVSEFQNTVGLPKLPPIWALGFHLCRYDYNSSARTQEINMRNRQAGIPVEVQWNDIDYMDHHNDFTYDHNKFASLPGFVDSLHQDNLHYVLILDPGVSQEANHRPYELGVEMNIFFKNSTNQTFVGKVWNDSGRTVFPDFSNPKSIEYWTKLFVEFHKEIPFDGAWIDMNDISNMIDGSIHGCPLEDPIENPIYVPDGTKLQHKSICLTAKHMAGIEYNVHNLYSFYEAVATHKALLATRPNLRSLVISRSTTVGQGSYGGHWSGDVGSNWDYLKWSIPSLIEHSMYGYTMMGTDICGFWGNTTAEMCARWSTLGAFYTFSRNHNSDVDIDQDPVALGQVVVDANKNAYMRKYALIPFAYSLITEANLYGSPVVRAVPFVFHDDPEARKVEYQFMWGDSLMISPIVDPGTETKRTYLPRGRWFETNILPASRDVAPKMIDSAGQWHETNNVDLTNLLIYHRGGHIVPTYTDVKASVRETMRGPFGLEAALDQNSQAKGELIMADGFRLDGKYTRAKFSVEKNKLHVKAMMNFVGPIDEVRIMPVPWKVANVTIHEVPSKQVGFTQQGHLLKLNLDQIHMNNMSEMTVEWS